MSEGPAPAHQQGLVKQTLLYGVVNVALLVVPVALAPILTHYLTPDDYGTLSVFDMAVALLAPLVGLGVQTSIRRKYFDLEPAGFSQYVVSACGACAFFLGVLALVTAIGVLVTPDVLGIRTVWLFVLVPWIAGRQLVSIAASFYQLTQRPLAHGMLTGGLTVLNVVLSLVLVIGLQMSWSGRVLGQALANLAFLLVSMAILVRHLRRPYRFSLEDARHALAYGAPTVPYTILDRVIAYTDRAIVIAYAGLGAAGLYALSSQIAGLLLMGTSSFGLAWEPWLYSRLRRNHARDRRAVLGVLALGTLTLAAGAAALAALAPVVLPSIVDARFEGAYGLLPLLVAGFACRGLTNVLSSIVLFEGRTRSLVSVTAIGAVVNLAANLSLVPTSGALGAAAATFIAFATTLAVMSWTAHRSWSRLAMRPPEPEDGEAHP